MKKRASKTLKDLKEKRVAFSMGGYGYGGGGGGSINEVLTTAQPIPAQTYNTSASAFTSSGPSYGGPTSGSSGTSYGGGNATGSSGSPTEQVVEEVLVEAEPILIEEGGFDADGNYRAPIYESQPTMGAGGVGSSSTPNTEESNENNEEEANEMPESTEKDERDFPVQDGRGAGSDDAISSTGGNSVAGSTNYTAAGSSAPLDI